MSSKVVKSMCEECFFNEEHQCHAGSIEVRSSGDNKVHSSEGICCSTFEAKNDTCGCRNH
ncbi:hypothetical protein CLHOM_12200 [Clostridium homopropionicum DSM 5847]|uniref:DUF1540 domain-containing protein n=1 Tax=Clostridium homopropionicum DSM 5847 TaxID=1121318 RepID=A0A0L6ZBQ3_9CLOT|nr:DUF1540 domain-containing protein [Clostridium homopropionicum]KOA20401.1 hypothetical protein CLHOM_12200 [Clostridium homopropionicum DSM 5847]SFG75227.1 protein of unknown function [Clostridium homopropionicum]